ncbi:hypothetical protein [Agromyces sp. GXS1127]|uniref:hypothetical protein n=1 Tax=Agromyces sp. GXS1127 TaxID=3424181 RepID=UPI003D3235F9
MAGTRPVWHAPQHEDEIAEALESEQAEQVSDTVLEAVADAVKKVVPDEHDGVVDDVKANLDRAVGNEP